jgi:hypothetical protein
VGLLAGKNARADALVRDLEPGGEVHGIADHGVVASTGRPDAAGNDIAGGDPLGRTQTELPARDPGSARDKKGIAGHGEEEIVGEEAQQARVDRRPEAEPIRDDQVPPIGRSVTGWRAG